ncbi:MAG: DegT/DnrJ/EryC1/StrS family aminotransferase [Clostridia bacterium]|nr:DegT/DnrJ/EryC1/StrS family aminotransferase [Clostridia bacterium]
MEVLQLPNGFLRRVPLAQPDITEREVAAVGEVVRSGILALGPKMVEFEEKVVAYVGRKYAVAVNSGTSGLHLLVRAYGIGEGDEVITTPFSFIASSNCLLYERARPVFIDIEPDTGNIDARRIEEAITNKTKAILPVDAFGQPARLDLVREIADRYGLVVIEDACEALGSEYKNQKAGSGAFSDAAVFAFYPNKQITTGEGGMIVTDDERVAKLCRSLRNQGRAESGLWLSHQYLGYNYRLDEMSAALGVVQMDRIEEIIEMRQRVAELYFQRLRSIPGVRLPYVAPEVTRMSWFVFVIRVGVDEPDPGRQRWVRDTVMQRLEEAGIGCRPYFTPIHLQPFYRERFGFKEGDFPQAEAFGRTSIAIPFHNRLTEEEIDYVGDVLEQALAELG